MNIAEFTEALKFEYPLTPASVVIDCGAYEGNWSREIVRRYDPIVFAFEPCQRFYEQSSRALSQFPKVRLFHLGVAASAAIREIGVANDSTGVYSQSPERETANFVDFSKFIPWGGIDLLKLNIEGGEYELLEQLTSDPTLAVRFKHILVQWHSCVPDSEQRRAAIHEKLLTTHDLAWGTNPLLWQSYTLRTP